MLCLVVKGELDGEIESAAMRRDWTEVSSLAGELGNTKWRYRAQGQLGFADFYVFATVTSGLPAMPQEVLINNRRPGGGNMNWGSASSISRVDLGRQLFNSDISLSCSVSSHVYLAAKSAGDLCTTPIIFLDNCRQNDQERAQADNIGPRTALMRAAKAEGCRSI